jgi:hypothetical protein
VFFFVSLKSSLAPLERRRPKRKKEGYSEEEKKAAAQDPKLSYNDSLANWRQACPRLSDWALPGACGIQVYGRKEPVVVSF